MRAGGDGYLEDDTGADWHPDGSLTEQETERLIDVRWNPEIAEQLQLETEACLLRMEAYWKFLRYLVEHGTFADDQLACGEGSYDE